MGWATAFLLSLTITNVKALSNVRQTCFYMFAGTMNQENEFRKSIIFYQPNNWETQKKYLSPTDDDITTQSTPPPFFKEDFEDTAASGNNWKIQNGSQANKWYIDTITSSKGRKSAYVSRNSGTATKLYEYTPGSGGSWVHIYADVTFPTGATQFALSFDWRCRGVRLATGADNDFMAVSLISNTIAPPNSNNFANYGNLDTFNLSEDWKREFIYLPDSLAGKTKRLVFSWRNASSGNYPTGMSYSFPAAIDNIEISAFNCLAPTNFKITYANADSVQFAWNSTSASLELQYKEFSEPESAYMPVVVSGLSHTLRGLTSGVGYEFRLRNVCGSDNESSWTPSILYKTPCSALQLTDLPYVQNFDSDSVTLLSPCLHSILDQGSGVGVVSSLYTFSQVFNKPPSPVITARIYNGSTNTATAYSGENAVALYQLLNNTSAILLSPPINGNINANAIRTRFMARNATTSPRNLQVGIMTNPFDTSTFIPVQTLSVPSYSTAKTYNTPKFGWRSFIVDLNAADFPNPSHSTYYIAFKNNNGNNSNNSIFIDDLCIEAKPVCQDVDSLWTIRTTPDSIYFGIKPAGGSFKIQYRELGETNWTYSTTTTDSIARIGQLSRITPYDFRVQRVCGTETGLWSYLPFIDTTTCGVMPESDLPWLEDFESLVAQNQVPECMRLTRSNATVQTVYTYITNQTTGPRTSRGNGHSYACFYRGVNSGCIDTMYAPLTYLQAGTSYEFSFWYKTDASTQWQTLGTIIGNSQYPNASSAIVGTPLQNVNTNLEYQQYRVNYTPTVSGNYSIGINCQIGSGSMAYLVIDDIKLRRTPLCDDITAFDIVGYPGESTATVNWSSDASNFSLEYKKTNETSWTTLPSVEGTFITDTFYTLQGLDPNTEYQARVRTHCTPGFGDYSSTVTFRTAQTPVGLPFEDNFEDTDNFGWTIVNGTQTNRWIWGTAPSEEGNDHSLYISNDGSRHLYTNGAGSIVHVYRDVTFGNEEEYVLSFKWKGNGKVSGISTKEDYLSVYLVDTNVRPSAGSYPGTALEKYNLNNAWKNDTIILQSSMQLQNTTKRLVFTWRNDGSTSIVTAQPPAAIDNISLSPRICAAPVNLSFSNWEDSSLMVHWSGSGELYTVQYKPSGTTDWEGIETFTTADTVFIMTSLLPFTQYDVRVKSSCWGIESEWSSTAVSKTLCAYLTMEDLPYTQNFNAATSPNLPDCWNKTTQTSSTVQVRNDNLVTRDGSNYAQLYSPTNDSVLGTMLISAPIDPSVDLREIRTRFWSKKYRDNLSNISMLTVGVMTDFKDPSTFVPFQIIELTPSWTYFTVDFANDHTFMDNHGVLYLAFRHNNNYNPAFDVNSYIYIDDVLIEPAPACPDVTGLKVTRVTQDSIYVTYRSTATSFDVSYRDTSVSYDWGTPVRINGTTADLSGLTPSTTYEIRVRSVCSQGEGYWSDSTVTAKTEQTPATLPFTEDFEYVSTSSKWNTRDGISNKWIIGTATHNGTGTHSAYISDDGSANHYALTPRSTVHLYRDIEFPQADEFIFSFDVKVNGEVIALNVIDYLSVSLVDVSTAIDTASQYSANAIPGLEKIQGVTNWTGKTISLPGSYAGTTKHLVFTWVNDNGGGSQPPAAIDNISLSAVACGRPYGVAVSNISETQATVTWSSSATDFVLEYKKKRESTWQTYSGTISSNSVTLTGLQNSSVYQIRVRANCSVTESSSWTDIIEFQTNCGVNTLPFNDSLTFTTRLPFNPICWETKTGIFGYTPDISTTVRWYNKPFAGVTNAPYTPMLNISGGLDYVGQNPPAGTPPTREWLISPTIDLGSLGSAQIEFDMALVKAGSSPISTTPNPLRPDTGGFDDKFIVAVSTDNGITWTALATWDNQPTTPALYRYDSISWDAEGERVVVPLMGIQGPVRIAFYGESTIKNIIPGEPTFGTSNDIYIKNVLVKSVCQPVSNIQASVIGTSSSVAIRWTAPSGQNEWEVVCKQGETVVSTHNVTTNPVDTLTNLTRDVNYTVSIRAICGEGDTSGVIVSDPFSVPSIPACSGVSNIAATPCATTAIVNWTAPAGQTQWELSYVEQGGENTVIDIVDATPIDTLTGLTPNTTYELRIRSICGAEDTSSYSSVYSFTTTVCQSVSGLTVVRKKDSLLISWDNNSCQDMWDIVVVPEDDPISTGTPVEVDSNRNVYISVPSSLDSYDVYVRARCGDNVYSEWSKYTSTDIPVLGNATNVKVILSPNPASQYVNLKIEGATGEVELQLTTITGKLLRKEKFACQTGLSKNITLQDLAKGTYLIYLKHKNWTKVEKLIVH